MNQLFALVDCNNFFASCERLFRPDLRKTPIIVLSNNDGCVIARSEEAKQAGIKMCDPYFKIKDTLNSLGVVPFSANFPLYSNISHRVMDSLSELCEEIEVYSVDEAFLNYRGYPFQKKHPQFLPNPKALALHIKSKIHQWVGIPVSIGMAPTKTLAKIAAGIAKKYSSTQNVFDLSPPAKRSQCLPQIPIEEIWGIGRKTIPKLKCLGIYTADTLATLPPDIARKQGGVYLERIVMELNGISCLTQRVHDEEQQTLMYSRTFGKAITQFHDIRQAVSNFSEEISSTLRKEQLMASSITILISTGPFRDKERSYSNTLSKALLEPSDDPRTLRYNSVQLLEQLWKPGFPYKRAGIILGDLSPVSHHQTTLPLLSHSGSSSHKPYPLSPDISIPPPPRSPKLTQALDSLNQNKKRIWYAAEGITRNPKLSDPRWKIIRNNLSPSYTTSWSQLPIID